MMNAVDASLETMQPPADLINASPVGAELPSADNAPPFTVADQHRMALHRHGRELFWNHCWESLNAGAKILFFAVVTPVMLARWGRDQFGVFAVANSCVALMAFVDLGLRMLTRVALTNPRLDASAKVRVHARNFAAFVIASSGTIALVALLAGTGCWHRWLHLPPAGDLVIIATVALTAILMSLQLLLERIAAAHRLSFIKSALFTGNLIAFFAVVALLARGAGVVPVTTTYFAALALPLLFLLPFAQLRANEFTAAISSLRLRDLTEAISSGGWINLITISWIFQSYGLVLLISWVAGPVVAGTFFLYLKLSDLLSVLGASTSEPIIAAIASGSAPRDRYRNFASGYKSAIALCLGGAVVYTFFCDDLFNIWLHRELAPLTGLCIGLLGFSSGLTRMVNNASLGLGKPRSAGLGLAAGAIITSGALVALGERASPEIILAIGSASVLFMIPAARAIAAEFAETLSDAWLRPIYSFLPTLLAIVLVCALASINRSIIAAVGAVLISLALCARDIFVRAPATRDALLGYDTRSWRSAIVMRAIDLLRPLRRAEPFAWSSPCVVSSIAGLGDLFIHLPLIAGIVNEARRRGLDIRVALRPAHVDIGRLCGWDVLPFDNTLEDFFKNPKAIALSRLTDHIKSARRDKTNLWIDLTGSAISAVAIKLAGAPKIAARITRGGRSLINYRLPHTIHENEYANLERIAAEIGCEFDYGIFDKLRGAPLPEFEDSVVLCLTTICRWRNWPMQNFLALVDQFPDVQFVATGCHAEVVAEDRQALKTLVTRPNVTSCMDKMSVLQLVRLIAHARAVITNDTSTAHIANQFHKPGAVLFGPASPDKLAALNGLKPFVDRTCPFHPCVQWKCSNQENWCMRKISVDAVAMHLASVLGNLRRRSEGLLSTGLQRKQQLGPLIEVLIEGRTAAGLELR